MGQSEYLLKHIRKGGGVISPAINQHEALKSAFCGMVEALEKVAPRAAVVSALHAAVKTERQVDELIAAADAETSSKD